MLWNIALKRHLHDVHVKLHVPRSLVAHHPILLVYLALGLTLKTFKGSGYYLQVHPRIF